jgi:DNA replication protein DnaC
MNELNRQLISMYTKQLGLPVFNHYEEVISQLDGNKSFDDFLVSLMQAELENRQESNLRQKIHAAHFPYTKTGEKFGCSHLENVSAAQIHQLASCNFIQNTQAVVMIGNPGTDKTHLSIIIGLSASKEGNIVHKQKQFKPKAVKTFCFCAMLPYIFLHCFDRMHRP